MWRIPCICLIFAALGAAQTKIDIVNQTSGNLPGGRVSGAVASATTATTATSATSATTATTATALASDPAACSAGQYVSDIAANGTLTCGTPAGGGGGISITRTPVTFSATPTFTRSSAVQQWAMTLTGNITSSTLSGASAGDLLSFEFTQDSTPRTVVMPTGFPALALCATSGSVTVAQYFWTGSAAIERSVNSPGCTERVIRWQDGTATTFPAGSDTVATLGGTQTFSGAKTFTGRLNLPNSTTRPATCIVGDVYIDTDATSGQRVYICESTDTWVVQGGGGGGGGAMQLGGTCTSNLQTPSGFCGASGFSTTAAIEAIRVPATGNLSDFWVHSRGYFASSVTCVIQTGALGAATGGATATYTGSNSALTVTIPGNSTFGSAEITGTNVAVTAGQDIVIQCSSASNGAGISWGVKLQ